MSRNWEVGPRKERWESVQAAVDDDHRNRANCPTNGSDDGVLRTGYVAPKTGKVCRRCSPQCWLLRQANDKDFFTFFGLDIQKNEPGMEPIRPESLRMRSSTDFECR